MAFKVGDKVRIKKNSRFYTGEPWNPKDVDGTVTDDSPNGCYRYRVSWGKGGNAYDGEDLEFADIKHEVSSCPHTNKYINRAMLQPFWVCPDCGEDLGNV